MLVIFVAWLYVALMMALAEALHPAGHWWGAVMTFLLYGVGPVSLALYLLTTPLRRKARANADARAAAEAEAEATAGSVGKADRGGHASGDAVAPEREIP